MKNKVTTVAFEEIINTNFLQYFQLTFVLRYCLNWYANDDVCSVQTAFVNFIDLGAKALHWHNYFIQKTFIALLPVAVRKNLSYFVE